MSEVADPKVQEVRGHYTRIAAHARRPTNEQRWRLEGRLIETERGLRLCRGVRGFFRRWALQGRKQGIVETITILVGAAEADQMVAQAEAYVRREIGL